MQCGHSLFWDPYKARKYTVWPERGIGECETGATYSDHWALSRKSVCVCVCVCVCVQVSVMLDVSICQFRMLFYLHQRPRRQ
jgi:hypothetical protein